MDKRFRKTSEYIKDLQKKGRYTFSLQECLKNVPKQPVAVKRDLDRLKKNEEILSIWKGFYSIITLEYATRGIMPPILFIDSLMKYLSKDYYVGLLSAAAQHGASHQQPQEFFIVTKKPPIRPLQKKGLRINFIVKNNWPLEGIETQKTSTGFVQVSSPELTALDLTTYVKRTGGFDRLAVILNELTEEMDADRLLKVVSGKQQITSLQRLGYMLDIILNKPDLSEALYNYLKKQKTVYVPLQTEKVIDQVNRNSKWKIIPNVEIDLSP